MWSVPGIPFSMAVTAAIATVAASAGDGARAKIAELLDLLNHPSAFLLQGGQRVVVHRASFTERNTYAR
jgi:hypothetical protein